MEKKYILIIIVLAIALGYITRYSTERLTTDTEYILTVDTIRQTDTVTKPKIITKVDTFFTDAEIITLIDSANCVKLAQNYYRKNIYIDTLVNDTNLFFVLTDTVFKNELQQRIFNYSVTKKTVIITPTSRNFYILAGLNLVYLNGFDYQISGGVVNKRWVFEGGAGKKSVSLGVKYLF